MEQSIPADQYTTKCRFSRVPRVSPDNLAQNAQSPVKTPSKSAHVARNGAQTSTVRPPQATYFYFADRVSSELLGDVRLAARSRVNSGHVTALVRADRRSFRHYDNDSDARQRGTFVSVSLRAVWGPFILYAVVQKGSLLLSAIDELQPVRMGDVDLT